jgi:polyphenol oxidase
VAFTDTRAGNLALHVGDNPDEVLHRRELLEREAGLGAGGFRFMNQVHGNDVAFIGAAEGHPTADAMVSHGVPLAVMVADCVPVVLVGERLDAPGDAGEAGVSPVFGVVHAGRPGVAKGVVPAAVREMRAAGASRIAAWVGPSICGACYEVPAGMRDDVAAGVPAAWSTTSWGTPGLDLPAGVRSQLAAEDVRVEYSGPCTLENEGLFSYRRSRHAGRFAGLVWGNG